jgi:hypothetical protein
MKGLMVTLLVMVMTGTVIAQQSNQPENSDKPGRFFLWLNDDLINELKTNPSGLIAGVPLSARGKITEVSLRYEKVHSDAHDDLSPKEGRFNLWLDDALIQQLKTNPLGLVANVPEPLRGKLEQVVLKYEANSNDMPDHFHPETPELTGTGIENSVLSKSDFSPPASSSNRWTTPSFSQTAQGRQTQLPADNSFPNASVESLSESLRRLRQQSTELPVSADEARRQTALNQQRQFGNSTGLGQNSPSVPQNNSDEFRPRFGTPMRPITQSEGWKSLPAITPQQTDPATTSSVDNSDVEFQSELIRRETEKLRQQRLAAERLAAERSLADQKARYQEELRLQNLRNQDLASKGVDSIETQTPLYDSDRYAMRTDQQPIQNPTYQFPTRRSESFAAPESYDYSTAPSRQKLTSAPRLAQNSSLNGMRAEISGPDSSGITTGGATTTPTRNSALGDVDGHNERAYKFMFFMLMFSIGVNVYLAWISRGFYVRYSELADELRETFTTSV